MRDIRPVELCYLPRHSPSRKYGIEPPIPLDIRRFEGEACGRLLAIRIPLDLLSDAVGREPARIFVAAAGNRMRLSDIVGQRPPEPIVDFIESLRQSTGIDDPELSQDPESLCIVWQGETTKELSHG